jgi:large subunit ribosomal protein L24
MQKVIRRTILAEKQVARRHAKHWEKVRRGDLKNKEEQARFHRKDEIEQIKKARQALREDWELGPLAPKRDVGDQKDSWGTINSLRSQGRFLTGKASEHSRGNATIRSGDRVAIMNGVDKGKIGRVTKVDIGRGECKVQGMNMVCPRDYPNTQL